MARCWDEAMATTKRVDVSAEVTLTHWRCGSNRRVKVGPR